MGQEALESFLFFYRRGKYAFLGQLILILLTTVLLGQLFARFNMPAVIGQLLSGILLGPAILNWVKPNDIISLFSEFGVILLMFLAGLESDLDLLKILQAKLYCRHSRRYPPRCFHGLSQLLLWHAPS